MELLFKNIYLLLLLFLAVLLFIPSVLFVSLLVLVRVFMLVVLLVLKFLYDTPLNILVFTVIFYGPFIQYLLF